jgi:hypothetical protein
MVTTLGQRMDTAGVADLGSGSCSESSSISWARSYLRDRHSACAVDENHRNGGWHWLRCCPITPFLIVGSQMDSSQSIVPYSAGICGIQQRVARPAATGLTRCSWTSTSRHGWICRTEADHCASAYPAGGHAHGRSNLTAAARPNTAGWSDYVSQIVSP